MDVVFLTFPVAKYFIFMMILVNINKRATMALDRSPELSNVFCHDNYNNSFCGQVS